MQLATRGSLTHCGGEIKPSFASRAIVCLIVLFLISSLYQNALESFSVNRILGVALVVILFIEYCRRMSHLRILAFIAVCFVLSWACLIETTHLQNELNDAMYWIAALLMIAYICDDTNLRRLCASMEKYVSLLKYGVMISGVTLAILLVAKIGYVSSWGGGSYFIGLCNTEHTMAAVCCLTMALVLYCGKEKALSSVIGFGVMVIASWALLQTGARTYLVPAAIIWFYALKYLTGQRWVRTILASVLILAVGFSFASSGMADKFLYVSTNQYATSSLGALSSGRSEFWVTDLSMYNASSVWNHFVGNSFSSVYDVNESTFTMRVWAHNDFIMLLCSVGIIGLSVYLAALVTMFRNCSNYLAIAPLLALVVYVIFPAFFNGFYINQHFVYSAIVLYILLVGSSESFSVVKVGEGIK